MYAEELHPTVDQNQLLRQVREAMKTQNYPAAIEFLKQAASAARRMGDRAAEGRHLSNLATLCHRIGQPEKALRYYDKALEAVRAESDRMSEDGILGSMGSILREIGRHEYAMVYLNQALNIAQEIGDFRGRGLWLANLGLVYDDMQEHHRAIDLHTQSIEIARNLNDQKGLAQRLDNIGNSYVAIGDFASALYYINEAANTYRDLKNWKAVTQRLSIMGTLYGELAKVSDDTTRDRQVFFTVAVDYFQHALLLAHDQNDRQAQAELLRNMAHIFLQMGQYDQAIYRLIPASQHFASLQLREQLADVQQTLAYAQSHRGGNGNVHAS